MMRKPFENDETALTFHDGDLGRIDGRPAAIKIDGNRSSLVLLLNGAEFPVDAEELTTLILTGRLKLHVLHVSPRRHRRRWTRSDRGRS